MRVLALLDGTLADPDSPLIRVDDLGLMRGDGVFETILVVDGKPRELTPHLDRLDRSAAMLDMAAPPRAEFERAVELVIGNWTGGKEFAVTLDRGIDAELADRAPWLLLGAKTLSYAINMAALREAERRGAAEVVFTTSDGSVLEGPTSTLILVRGKTLVTPPSKLGILPGTTQYALFRAAERAGWTVLVEPIQTGELYDAEGVFLASSVRKITRVNTLDGKQLPDSAALLTELQGLYESEY
jgi:4-amino-4-deoxychorismate lyase